MKKNMNIDHGTPRCMLIKEQKHKEKSHDDQKKGAKENNYKDTPK